jgi:hypothetical protein
LALCRERYIFIGPRFPGTKVARSQREDAKMRNTRYTILVSAGAAAAVISVSPVSATMRITSDRGGLLTAYVERFEAARASGEPVIIDGACLSACTLAIGMLPRGQLCATQNAVLGFHAAWRPTVNGGKITSSTATQALYELYPADVRDWIARRGGLSGRIIFLKGRELNAMVRACDAGDALRSNPTTRTARHDLLSRSTLAAQKKR